MTWIARGTRKEERVTLKILLEIYSMSKRMREDFFTRFSLISVPTIVRQELIDVARFMDGFENHPPSTTHDAPKHSSNTNPSDQDGSTFVIGRESMVPTDGVDPSVDVRDVDSVSRRVKRGVTESETEI